MRTTFPTHLSDTELLNEVKHFAHCEREATAQLVAHLAELDSRGLYLAAGFSSLYTYCRDVLRLSESEAYNRIEAARAARRFPVILALLASASLNLTTARLLAPHLTTANHEQLLAAAKGLKKREVEELLARAHPRPDVPASIRKLPTFRRTSRRLADDANPQVATTFAASTDSIPGPEPAASTMRGAARSLAEAEPFLAGTDLLPAGSDPLPAGSPSMRAGSGSSLAGRALPPSPRAVIMPLAADRYQIKFTASAETCRKLQRAQDLLRHVLPTGDPAAIFDRALSALLTQLAKQKAAVVKNPSGSARSTAAQSRHVPASVRRAIWARDAARCAFVSAAGRRCEERGFLEFHHVRPHAVGGGPAVENIQLRCRAHNGYEARLFFQGSGGLVPERVRARGTSDRVDPATAARPDA